MCVSHEGPDSSAGATMTGTGPVEHMLVTADRVGVNLNVYHDLDWSKVMPFAVLGGIGGAWNGWPGVALGSVLGAAGSIETQTGLTDLFHFVNDIPVIPGLPGPYLPMH
jgi:hypothetical protein